MSSSVAPDHEPLSTSSFQLRGTHLYLMLDDIVQEGPQEILNYIDNLVQSQQPVESVFVKGAMSRTATRIPEPLALAVFSALSRLRQSMQRLEVSGDGRFGGLFLPVSAMTVALQHLPPQLVSLRLANVILTSPRNGHSTAALRSADLQALAQSLRKLPQLTSIDLVRCRSETLAEGQVVTLQPIVQAVSSMSTLQQVMFCETLISGNTGLYLGELCKSNSIQKLWWKTMPGMNDSHIEIMAQQLQNNTTLRELTIRSHGLGRQAGQAIADLLRHNTTLQVINLDLDRGEYGLVLADALKTNCSLKCLDVWAWNDAGAGEENNNSSQIITKEFTDMLQCNMALQFLTFQGLDWNNPQIDFCLRLNRAGRQSLLRHTEHRKLWTDALIKHKEDLDVVYYFLSLNPTILARCNNSKNLEKLRKNEEPKKISKRKADTPTTLLDQRTPKKAKTTWT